MSIGAMDPFHELTIAMRFGMTSPAARDDEDNGEVDNSLSLRRISVMRDYGRWGLAGWGYDARAGKSYIGR